jgi:hypothetical protein
MGEMVMEYMVRRRHHHLLPEDHWKQLMVLNPKVLNKIHYRLQVVMVQVHQATHHFHQQDQQLLYKIMVLMHLHSLAQQDGVLQFLLHHHHQILLLDLHHHQQQALFQYY